MQQSTGRKQTQENKQKKEENRKKNKKCNRNWKIKRNRNENGNGNRNTRLRDAIQGPLIVRQFTRSRTAKKPVAAIFKNLLPEEADLTGGRLRP